MKTIQYSPVVTFILLVHILCAAQLSGQDIDKPRTPLRLSIHYLDGLSSRSSPEPDIRFLGYGCPLSLLLTNDSDESIVLWKPSCPPGDDAIRLEFKLHENSTVVGVARTSHDYTGGMGFPKTMTLAADDSLVYQIDFSSYWSLPFVLAPGQQASVYVRAVYESKREDAHPSIPQPDDASKVWEGRIETNWQRVTLSNTTNDTVPKIHRGINVLK